MTPERPPADINDEEIEYAHRAATPYTEAPECGHSTGAVLPDWEQGSAESERAESDGAQPYRADSDGTEPLRAEPDEAEFCRAEPEGAAFGRAESGGAEVYRPEFGVAAVDRAEPHEAAFGLLEPDGAEVDRTEFGDAESDRAEQGEAAEATAANEPEWRRLSARMLLVHPIQELRRYLVPLVVVVLFGGRSRPEIWSLIAVGVLVAIGMIRWFTTTYRVTPTQVQVRKGLLQRSTITVPRDRVRTVDLTSNLLHRILGLARLTIGTGQTDRKKEDLRLDALAVGAADRLRDELLHHRLSVAPISPAPASAVLMPPVVMERTIARLNPAWVWYAPFTLSGLVTIGVFAGVMLNAINQAHVDVSQSAAFRTVRHQLSTMSAVEAGIVVSLLLIIVVTVLSIGGYVLQFWNFRLSRFDGTLHVSRGLLTTRATTIEERRLRGAEISEPLLLRWVRGARCVAITTGLRVGRGAERGGSVLMPAAPAAIVGAVAADVLGGRAPIDVPLIGHGRRARRRRYTRMLYVVGALIAVTGVLWWFANWPAWLAIVALCFLPIGICLAADRARNLGHALASGYLVVRQGSAIRRRYMVSCDGIIGWTERASFWQRRAGVATLRATTAAGRGAYSALDIEPAVGIALARRATPGLLEPFLTTPPTSED